MNVCSYSLFTNRKAFVIGTDYYVIYSQSSFMNRKVTAKDRDIPYTASPHNEL